MRTTRELAVVDSAHLVARRIARLHGFDWRGYLQTLDHELRERLCEAFG